MVVDRKQANHFKSKQVPQYLCLGVEIVNIVAKSWKDPIAVKMQTRINFLF